MDLSSISAISGSSLVPATPDVEKMKIGFGMEIPSQIRAYADLQPNQNDALTSIQSLDRTISQKLEDIFGPGGVENNSIDLQRMLKASEKSMHEKIALTALFKTSGDIRSHINRLLQG